MKPAKKKQKRIWVSDEITRQLKTEFSVSGNTVLLALKFATYSEVSKKIRERALVLIKESLKDSEQLMAEFN